MSSNTEQGVIVEIPTTIGQTEASVTAITERIALALESSARSSETLVKGLNDIGRINAESAETVNEVFAYVEEFRQQYELRDTQLVDSLVEALGPEFGPMFQKAWNRRERDRVLTVVTPAPNPSTGHVDEALGYEPMSSKHGAP